MRAETLGGWLERASRRPDVGLGMLDRSERTTWFPWSDVRRRATEVCGGLQRAGVRPGDRVALVFPTSMEFIDGFFGAVLADTRVRPILGPAVAAAEPPLGCRTLGELDQGSGEPVGRTPDDLALVQFSSGTTADPKPVALSNRAVTAQAVALNAHWPDEGGTVNSGVSWLPLYHDMGLIGCIFTALERPGTMTLIPPELFLARPAVWLRALSSTGATISVAPNFAYGLCTEKIADQELAGVDLSRWRAALCGAEPVVPRVLRRFVERFSAWGLRPEALTPVYGLSEATLAVTFSGAWFRRAYRRAQRGLNLAFGGLWIGLGIKLATTMR